MFVVLILSIGTMVLSPFLGKSLSLIGQDPVTAALLVVGSVGIPPCTPHWVRYGPDTSVSVTLAYHTAASARERSVEDFNALARQAHLNPREPGRSAIVDAAKIGAVGVWSVGRRLRHGRPEALAK